MWGFFAGTLALVVLQTLLKPGSASQVSAGAGTLASVFTRLLSPSVPGLPQSKAAKAATAAAPAAPGTATTNPSQFLADTIAKQIQANADAAAKANAGAKNKN